MAEFPAMPLWTDAYLADTGHLTTIEHGAYFLLLITMWRTREKSLPNDDRLLARYTKLGPKQWARMKPIILPFFDQKNGRLFQRRLTDEAVAVKRHRERQSNAGKASALKRKGRHATAVDLGSNQTSTPTPTPTPIEDPTDLHPPSPQGTDLVLVGGGEKKSDPVNDAYLAFVAIAEQYSLPKPTVLSKNRRGLIKARIKEHGIEAIQRVLDAYHKSKFLRGERGNEGWIGKGANIDWAFRPTNFLKILEGRYDDPSAEKLQQATNADRQRKGAGGIFDDVDPEFYRRGQNRE